MELELWKSRSDAKMQDAMKACLAGDLSAIETCFILDARLERNSTLLSKDDRNFLTGVTSETDHLPVGALKDNWHPDFLPAKLDELAKYEATISEAIKQVCMRLLAAMEAQSTEDEIE